MAISAVKGRLARRLGFLAVPFALASSLVAAQPTPASASVPSYGWSGVITVTNVTPAYGTQSGSIVDTAIIHLRGDGNQTIEGSIAWHISQQFSDSSCPVKTADADVTIPEGDPAGQGTRVVTSPPIGEAGPYDVRVAVKPVEFLLHTNCPDEDTPSNWFIGGWYDGNIQAEAPAGWSTLSGQYTHTPEPGNVLQVTTSFSWSLTPVADSNPGTARVRVVKTVGGSSPTQPAGEGFLFSLRDGASAITAGTLLDSREANSTNSGLIDLSSELVDGHSYQVCEVVMPGWSTSLTNTFVLYDPSGSNAVLCSSFVAHAGVLSTFSVNNTPPPNGLARTIGFWKNWASCSSSKGRQRPILDRTLSVAEPAGVSLGSLTLHGSFSDPDRASDCLKAVRLLNKSTITGVRRTSDPAFNLAAQLLAATLNVVAGAGSCSTANTAIAESNGFLTTVHFDGISHDKLSSTQASGATLLATRLDRFNNDVLC